LDVGHVAQPVIKPRTAIAIRFNQLNFWMDSSILIAWLWFNACGSLSAMAGGRNPFSLPACALQPKQG
jgi:hypothetical protein